MYFHTAYRQNTKYPASLINPIGSYFQDVQTY